jgi:hypothetical protein
MTIPHHSDNQSSPVTIAGNNRVIPAPNTATQTLLHPSLQSTHYCRPSLMQPIHHYHTHCCTINHCSTLCSTHCSTHCSNNQSSLHPSLQ